VLEKIWNDLDDLEKVKGGGAEAFWKRADGGRQFDLDPTLDAGEPELKELKEEIERYEHAQKKTLTTRGVKVNNLGSDVADFSPQVTSIISLISAATGIPQRVLMGSEQGKLAAKQDRASWDNQITDRQEDECEARMARPLFDYLIKIGVLPEPQDGPGAYEIKFSSIRTMDDEQRAAIANNWASLNKPNMPPVVLPDEIREVLGLEPIAEVADEETLRAIAEGYGANTQEPTVAARKGGADRYQHIHAAADRFRAGGKAGRLRRVREGTSVLRAGLAAGGDQ
jgi:hypothetical protein